MGRTDERTAEMEEGLMDIRPALIADGQAAVLAQPGQRALHAPAVPPPARAAVHALAGAAHLDAALTQGAPTARAVVRLVRVHLVWALAWTARGALDGRDAIAQRREDAGIGAVGRGEQHRARESLPVAHNMALAARFAAIRRIRPGFLAPLL